MIIFSKSNCFFIAFAISISFSSVSFAETESFLDYLSPEDKASVRTIIEAHQDEISILPLAEYSPTNQALYLGSYLALNGEKRLGHQVLLHGLDYADDYSNEDLSSVYNLLASTEEDDNRSQAEIWYQQAVALSNATACINFGVFYEKQDQYEKAAGVYRQCTLPPEKVDVVDKETIALAYLNLGSLYYNGLLKGGKSRANQLKGGTLWQTSYRLNPFDMDVNYDLGVYYFHVVKDYNKSRYHFSACSTSDIDCARSIRDPHLIGHFSEAAYLQDVLDAKGYARRSLLEDRAKYWLATSAFFDIPESFGTLHLISSSGKVKGVAITFKEETADKAIIALNRLVFVDLFGPINAISYDWSLGSLKPIHITHLGQAISLEKEQSSWRYQIIFSPL